KVEDFDKTIADKTIMTQHDVFRFDVAMHDSRGVRSFECHRYLNSYAKRFIDLDPVAPKPMTQSFTIDELSSDVMSFVRLADLKNCENVWMVEGENRSRFMLE